jgi:hypothetical protein
MRDAAWEQVARLFTFLSNSAVVCGLPLIVTARPMTANGTFETSTDVRYTAAFGV